MLSPFIGIKKISLYWASNNGSEISKNKEYIDYVYVCVNLRAPNS